MAEAVDMCEANDANAVPRALRRLLEDDEDMSNAHMSLPERLAVGLEIAQDDSDEEIVDCEGDEEGE